MGIELPRTGAVSRSGVEVGQAARAAGRFGGPAPSHRRRPGTAPARRDRSRRAGGQAAAAGRSWLRPVAATRGRPRRRRRFTPRAEHQSLRRSPHVLDRRRRRGGRGVGRSGAARVGDIPAGAVGRRAAAGPGLWRQPLFPRPTDPYGGYTAGGGYGASAYGSILARYGGSLNPYGPPGGQSAARRRAARAYSGGRGSAGPYAPAGGAAPYFSADSRRGATDRSTGRMAQAGMPGDVGEQSRVGNRPRARHWPRRGFA